MQLDIFEHSRDVMLLNDVVAALTKRDAGGALARRNVLAREYPDAACLADIDVMIDALAKPLAPMHTLRDVSVVRQWLEEALAPAAIRVMGASAAQAWCSRFWCDLAASAGALQFHPDYPLDHAAPLWLRVGRWDEAVAAVSTIASWRRKPLPLAWMLQAKLALVGFQASLAFLAELAWMAPTRMEALVAVANEPLLLQLGSQFEAGFAGFGQVEDWAWFPAWLLIQRTGFAEPLAAAQAGNHSPAESATRTLLGLLALERQGRQKEMVEKRKQLKGLNAALFAAYMQTR